MYCYKCESCSYLICTKSETPEPRFCSICRGVLLWLGQEEPKKELKDTTCQECGFSFYFIKDAQMPYKCPKCDSILKIPYRKIHH